MQNEFEKQVQQKMEELKLVPSTPVWENVEKQIRKKREKRRFFFFLIPVGLLTAVAIWWMTSNHNNLQSTQNTISSNPSVSPDKKQTNSQHKDPNNKTQEQTEDQAKAKTERQKSTVIFNQEQGGKTQNKTEVIKIEKQSRHTTIAKSKSTKGVLTKPSTSKSLFVKNQVKNKKTDPIPIEDDKTVETKRTGTDNIQPPVEMKEEIHVERISTPLIADLKQQEFAKPDSSLKKDTAKRENTKPGIKIFDSSAKKKVAKSDNKWGKTFTFQAGVSKYAEAIFAAQKSLAFPIPTGSIGSGNNYAMHDSAGSNSGFSFAIGGGVKRKLGNRLEFNAALQYHFYSVRGVIGEKRTRDTSVIYSGNNLSVSGYYTNGNVSNYTTKYGVLEVPVSISYQVLKKIPLQVSAGVSYGRLLHSNELTFDNSKSIYYENKKNNIKNFFGLFSTLQYRVFAKDKMKITTGPAIQYLLSGTQKQDQYSKPHLLFAGIKTDINF